MPEAVGSRLAPQDPQIPTVLASCAERSQGTEMYLSGSAWLRVGKGEEK